MIDVHFFKCAIYFLHLIIRGALPSVHPAGTIPHQNGKRTDNNHNSANHFRLHLDRCDNMLLFEHPSHSTRFASIRRLGL